MPTREVARLHAPGQAVRRFAALPRNSRICDCVLLWRTCSNSSRMRDPHPRTHPGCLYREIGAFTGDALGPWIAVVTEQIHQAGVQRPIEVLVVGGGRLRREEAA